MSKAVYAYCGVALWAVFAVMALMSAPDVAKAYVVIALVFGAVSQSLAQGGKASQIVAPIISNAAICLSLVAGGIWAASLLMK